MVKNEANRRVVDKKRPVLRPVPSGFAYDQHRAAFRETSR